MRFPIFVSCSSKLQHLFVMMIPCSHLEGCCRLCISAQLRNSFPTFSNHYCWCSERKISRRSQIEVREAESVFSAYFLVGILSNTWTKVLLDPPKYPAADWLLASKCLTHLSRMWLGCTSEVAHIILDTKMMHKKLRHCEPLLLPLTIGTWEHILWLGINSSAKASQFITHFVIIGISVGV